MKHTINDKKVEIGWEQSEFQEEHGSGFTEWAISGLDDDGNEYTAIGYYQHDELTEVADIQQI
jgi:hypothetical protein